MATSEPKVKNRTTAAIATPRISDFGGGACSTNWTAVPPISTWSVALSKDSARSTTPFTCSRGSSWTSPSKVSVENPIRPSGEIAGWGPAYGSVTEATSGSAASAARAASTSALVAGSFSVPTLAAKTTSAVSPAEAGARSWRISSARTESVPGRSKFEEYCDPCAWAAAPRPTNSPEPEEDDEPAVLVAPTGERGHGTPSGRTLSRPRRLSGVGGLPVQAWVGASSLSVGCLRGTRHPRLDDLQGLARVGDHGRQVLQGRDPRVRGLRGATERGEVGAGRGAEHPLEGRAMLGSALLEEAEDPAAVVVDDDDRELGPAAPADRAASRSRRGGRSGPRAVPPLVRRPWPARREQRRSRWTPSRRCPRRRGWPAR